MKVHRAAALHEALQILRDSPDAVLLAGGTDLMVELGRHAEQPEAVVALSSTQELKRLEVADGLLHVGAAVTYREFLSSSSARSAAPALAQAARTVGSPQIRNAGTIVGNIATASPAGDTLPPLFSSRALVTLRSLEGERNVTIGDLIVGPKQTDVRTGEIITSVAVPVARGPQQFLKVGIRNAMAIAIASVAVTVDTSTADVGICAGAVGPTPIVCTKAEQLAATTAEWAAPRWSDADIGAVADAASEEVSPIDDHRSTASYRRHAVATCVRRAFRRIGRE